MSICFILTRSTLTLLIRSAPLSNPTQESGGLEPAVTPRRGETAKAPNKSQTTITLNCLPK